ncbi:O-antigen ligase family protein [Devosia insulae]|nr:O-antigen ligase family protein [Devosia insulae]
MTALPDQAMERTRRHAVPTRRGNANDRLGGVLLLLVGLSPLPLGSNRPAFWAAWGVVLGVIGLVYFLSLRARGSALRISPWRLPEVTILFIVLLLFVVVQVLPLGGLGYSPIQVLPRGLQLSASSISLDPATTSLTLLQFACYGLLALLFRQVGYRNSRADRVLNAIFVIIVAYGLLGIVLQGQLGALLGIPGSGSIATGPFVNRNSYATYLTFGLAIGVALAIGQLEQGESRRKRHRRVATLALIGAGLFVIGAALVATQSRMGFVAGLVGALSVTLLALAGRRLGTGIWLGILAVLLLGTIGMLALNGGGLLERVGSLETAGDVRVDLYRQVWQMIVSSPLVGYGGGTFEGTFPLFHQLPVSPDVVWNKAHSTYFALWAEFGLIFGTLPLIIVVAAAIRLLAARPSGPRLAAIGVIVVAAVHSSVDFSLEIEAVAFVFVAIVFLAIGAGIGAAEQRRDHA